MEKDDQFDVKAAVKLRKTQLEILEELELLQSEFMLIENQYKVRRKQILERFKRQQMFNRMAAEEAEKETSE